MDDITTHPGKPSPDGEPLDAVALRDQQVLGRALRAVRQNHKLTQEALGLATGIDKSYMSGMENGRRGLRWHTVMRLLRGMGASVSELAAEVDRLYGE